MYGALCGTEDRVTEGLWVLIRGEAGKSNIVVGIGYESCGQYKEMAEIFKQLKEVIRSLTLVLMDWKILLKRT